MFCTASAAAPNAAVPQYFNVTFLDIGRPVADLPVCRLATVRLRVLIEREGAELPVLRMRLRAAALASLPFRFPKTILPETPLLYEEDFLYNIGGPILLHTDTA